MRVQIKQITECDKFPKRSIWKQYHINQLDLYTKSNKNFEKKIISKEYEDEQKKFFNEKDENYNINNQYDILKLQEEYDSIELLEDQQIVNEQHMLRNKQSYILQQESQKIQTYEYFTYLIIYIQRIAEKNQHKYSSSLYTMYQLLLRLKNVPQREQRWCFPYLNSISYFATYKKYNSWWKILLQKMYNKFDIYTQWPQHIDSLPRGLFNIYTLGTSNTVYYGPMNQFYYFEKIFNDKMIPLPSTGMETTKLNTNPNTTPYFSPLLLEDFDIAVSDPILNVLPQLPSDDTTSSSVVNVDLNQYDTNSVATTNTTTNSNNNSIQNKKQITLLQLLKEPLQTDNNNEIIQDNIQQKLSSQSTEMKNDTISKKAIESEYIQKIKASIYPRYEYDFFVDGASFYDVLSTGIKHPFNI